MKVGLAYLQHEEESRAALLGADGEERVLGVQQVALVQHRAHLTETLLNRHGRHLQHSGDKRRGVQLPRCGIYTLADEVTRYNPSASSKMGQ